MNSLAYLFTGGFAKGYRTYLLQGIALAAVAVKWAIGDVDTATLVTELSIILGLGTAANHGVPQDLNASSSD